MGLWAYLQSYKWDVVMVRRVGGLTEVRSESARVEHTLLREMIAHLEQTVAQMERTHAQLWGELEVR